MSEVKKISKARLSQLEARGARVRQEPKAPIVEPKPEKTETFYKPLILVLNNIADSFTRLINKKPDYSDLVKAIENSNKKPTEITIKRDKDGKLSKLLLS